MRRWGPCLVGGRAAHRHPARARSERAYRTRDARTVRNDAIPMTATAPPTISAAPAAWVGVRAASPTRTPRAQVIGNESTSIDVATERSTVLSPAYQEDTNAKRRRALRPRFIQSTAPNR